MTGTCHETVQTLRRFNRFYTRFVGALEPRFLGGDLSLAEARVLYELATRDAALASDIQAELGLDAGYVSRILRRFEARGWLSRARGSDARRRPITPTDAGRAAFALLDTRQRAHVERSVEALSASDHSVLARALDTTRTLLGGGAVEPYSVRPFRTGDMGLINARQSMLYADVYRWGRGMEIMIGDITTGFLRDFKPGREQCWVAERGGAMTGSVFVVDAGDNVAQLRLLYVEPWARGLGIGRDLVDRCVALARAAGYREIMLWTHSVLLSARKIYEAAGFRITSVEVHDEFGEPEQGETWRMELSV